MNLGYYLKFYSVLGPEKTTLLIIWKTLILKISELDEIDKLSATKNDSHIILEKSIDDIVKEVSSVLYNAACLGDRDKRISKNKKLRGKLKNHIMIMSVRINTEF